MDQSAQDLRDCYEYVPDFVTKEEEEYLLRKISETPQPKWKNVTKRRLQIWGGHIGAGNTLLSQPLPAFLTTYPNLIERLAATGVFDQSAHKGPNHVIINEYKPGEGIMPHEDGPSYHPVVATISLGSHAVFHYHRYRGKADSDGPSAEVGATAALSSREAFAGPSAAGEGRSIDPKPVLSLLLEPRSVIITRGALYQEYLHCIQEVNEDVVIGTEKEGGEGDGVVDVEEKGYRIDNWDKVGDEELRRVVTEGGILQRGTRVSLTCRDVEKTKKIVGLPGFGR